MELRTYRFISIGWVCSGKADRKEVEDAKKSPIVFDEEKLNLSRDEIADRLLKDYSIQVRKYFYALISDLHCYSKDYNSGNTPIAKRISKQVVTLPLYVELENEQVDFICESFENILK